MAIVLALEQLYDDVVAIFDAELGAAAPAQPFGWREPARQPRRRIVWVPGDDGSGAIGEVGAPRYPGRNPRPLWTIGELFTVYVEAFDAAAPEDERAQYHAARVLLDAWLRAVHLAAYGTVRIVDVAWAIGRKVRRHGATIRVLASVEAMVPDSPYAEVDDAGAEIETSELDVTETTTAPAP